MADDWAKPHQGMVTTKTTQLKPERFVSKPEARRFGYALAIGINTAMVWIVFNVAE